jgi:hypothetical protein
VESLGQDLGYVLGAGAGIVPVNFLEETEIRGVLLQFGGYGFEVTAVIDVPVGQAQGFGLRG